MTEFLEYKLIEFGKISISVYNVLFIIVMFLIIKGIVWAFTLVLNRVTTQDRLDQGMRFTLRRLLQYLLYTIGVVLALENLGFNISVLLAGSAALLVGVGLGLQHVVNDFFSGLIILFEGVIKIGDIIEFQSLVARVEKIDLRTTKVKTRNGNYIIIPNSQITNNQVINWSHNHEATRFNVKVGVAYGSDTAKVKDILFRCAEEHPNVLKGQTVIFFSDFGDSALVFDVYFWSEEQWFIERVISEIRFAVDKAFRESGIVIPFPQRDLHIKDPRPGT